MLLTFRLDKLQDALKDFYTVTHIRITVFDEQFNELAAYPEEIAPICRIIRKDQAAAAACHACDARACETAAKRLSPYTYTCHAGLTESIMPLVLGRIPVAYLFFGHVFAYPSHEDGYKAICSHCRDYKLDECKLKAACDDAPLMTREYIESASHLLQAVASYLALDRMNLLKYEPLPLQIDEYIQKHFAEDVSIPRLCEEFDIGKTALCRLAQVNYGCGIAQYVRTLRIRHAKTLLKNHPEMSISEVAEACGYPDYNYFMTVFRRETGTTPRKYRMRE